MQKVSFSLGLLVDPNRLRRIMQDDSFMPIFRKLFQMYIDQGSHCKPGEEQNNTKLVGNMLIHEFY